MLNFKIILSPLYIGYRINEGFHELRLVLLIFKACHIFSESNFKWDLEIEYESPKDLERKKHKFKAVLWLSFIKKRNKENDL